MLIYIEHKGKVKKIPKPSTVQDLRDKFAEKFELASVESTQIYYIDSQNEEITIIDDEDYAISFENPASGLKFILRFEERPKRDHNNHNVSMAELENYSKFLESSLPVEKIAQVQSFMNQDFIPCYECFDFENEMFRSDRSQWVDDYNCKKCNGTGRLPRKKMWSLIMSLIDFKIKQFVVNPIKNQFAGLSEANESFEKSNISEMPEVMEHELNIINAIKKVPERARATEMPKLSIMQVNTQQTMDLGIRDNFLMNEKQSIQPRSEIVSLVPKRHTIHEENYEKKRLDFCLTNAKATLIDNLVEVEIEIENNKKTGWPDQVHLRGDKTSEFTKNFFHREPITLGPLERKTIDFYFKASEAILSSEKVALVFQFFAVDERAQVFYSSMPFKIKLEK